MGDNLVSVIITTHNRVELLKRAVCSVFEQSFPNIECIIVDDDSSDSTEVFCKTQNVVYIHIPNNESRGGNYARNLGIKAAKGNYVAFLDDDDYWDKSKIEKQMQLVNEYGAKFVFTGQKHEIVDRNGAITYKNFPVPKQYTGAYKKKVLYNICTNTSRILVAKDVLWDVGLFDEQLKFWQEYELTIRIAQKYDFYAVEEPLTIYRVNLNDKSRLTNKYDEWLETVSVIKNKHKNLYQNLNNVEKMMAKVLFYMDARRRCINVGLRSKARIYYLKAFPLLVVRKIAVFFKIV